MSNNIDIWGLTCPYSLMYECDITSPGSLPFFLIGMNGTFNARDISGPNRKPRESNAVTASTGGFIFLAVSIKTSFNSWKISGFCKTENTSLKHVTGNN